MEKIPKAESNTIDIKKTENNNNNADINFNIKLKLSTVLKYHNRSINCSTLLKDGRFVTCSRDNSIIIYNN